MRQRASHKTSDLLFVLIHHFGGNQVSLRSHVKLLNDLGYDCLTFDLESYKKPGWKTHFSRQGRFGICHVWADQIEDILTLTGEPKVVLSQSVSGIPALTAIARIQCKNIYGFIGDGGPFFEFTKSLWNLYTHIYPIPLPIRPLACLAGMISFGINVENHTNDVIRQLPNGFPVLSLRAEKDRLITLSSMDKVFSKQEHINIKVVHFKNSDHLKPCKDEPEKYKKAIVQFLNGLSLDPP